MKKRISSLIILAVFILHTTAQNIIGTWNGELNAGLQKIPLVLNLTADGKCTLDSPQQGAKGIPANIDLISTDSLSISVSSLNAAYSARLQNGELKGTFTQNGFKLPLSLKPGKRTEANRPQTPKPPYSYETEEVTFTNTKAGATLAGTLTLPKDAKCVLLMVTGSGQQNRDEALFEHQPFAVIADFLARQGIATQNLPALQRTLPDHKRTLIKQYDDLNHLFQHCQTGMPTEYGQIEETISEEVLKDIADWIHARACV